MTASQFVRVSSAKVRDAVPTGCKLKPRSRPGRAVARIEQPIRVPLAMLRPTQATIGMRAVVHKHAKVTRRLDKRRRLERFLDARPIPSVRGPGGQLFIIDHHHLSLALWLAEIESAIVTVLDDLSALPPAGFWRRMEVSGRLYPFDEAGVRMTPSQLPRTLMQLRPDIYRDLSWSVREQGGFEKSPVPFAEFRWAEFFRRRIAERTVATDYTGAIERAMELARSRAASSLPGYLAD